MEVERLKKRLLQEELRRRRRNSSTYRLLVILVPIAVLLTVAARLVPDRDPWEPFDPYRYFPDSLHWAVSILYPRRAGDSDAPDIAVLAESG